MLIYLSTRLRRAKLSAQKMFFRYAAPLPLRPSILLGIHLQAHKFGALSVLPKMSG
jgi:hypothetical protein